MGHKICNICACDRVCNHDINGFENCDNYTPRWISTGEALPPDDSFVLTIVNGTYKNITFHSAYQLAFYDPSDGWVLETFPEIQNLKIDYWMPLPALPDGLKEMAGDL